MAQTTVKTDISHATEVIEHYLHFGYFLKESKETTQGEVILAFERKQLNVTPQLIELEKQYNKTNKVFPIAATIWAVLGVGFLFAYFVCKNVEVIKLYVGFIIPLFIICFAISIFLLIIFFTLLFNKRKIQSAIILKADKLQGLLKEVPITEFMEPAKEQTGAITRSIDSLINNNVR